MLISVQSLSSESESEEDEFESSRSNVLLARFTAVGKVTVSGERPRRTRFGAVAVLGDTNAVFCRKSFTSTHGQHAVDTGMNEQVCE